MAESNINTVCDVIKCHVIFFVLRKLAFLSQKNDTILGNYKKFMLPENQLILRGKNV